MDEPETSRTLFTQMSDEQLDERLAMVELALFGATWEALFENEEYCLGCRRWVPRMEGEVCESCRHDMMLEQTAASTL